MSGELDEIFVSGESEEFEVEHKGKVYQFAKKELSWAETNKLLSKAVKISDKGIEVQLNIWFEEYLIAALTKAPWNLNETRISLKKLSPEFGAKLEKFVPKPTSLAGEADFFVQE